MTKEGNKLIKMHRAERVKQLEEEDQAERNKEEIDNLTEGLSHEEIVRRLRGTP